MFYIYYGAVDFSSPVYIDRASILAPVKLKDNMWSFTHPFDVEVWAAFLFSLPVYIISMALADYIFYKEQNWGYLIEFIIRETFNENVLIMKLKYHFKRTFHTVFVIVWIWTMFLLTAAYSGNLKAMLTRPSFEKPIKTLEDLTSQDYYTWMLPPMESATDYLKGFPSGSPLKKLYDQGGIYEVKGTADEWWGCCLAKWQKYDGKSASICDSYCIKMTSNLDYSSSGRCNYYSVAETFLTLPQVMALQKGNRYFNNDVNKLLDLATQMGLVEGLFKATLKNGSKCDTWNKIRASHRGSEENVILKTDDLRGMLIFLVIGLSNSFMIFFCEILMHHSRKSKVKVDRVAKKCANLAIQDLSGPKRKLKPVKEKKFSHTRTDFLADLCNM